MPEVHGQGLLEVPPATALPVSFFVRQTFLDGAWRERNKSLDCGDARLAVHLLVGTPPLEAS